jgi:two-component system nitrate/nitrite response regulator NarL
LAQDLLLALRRRTHVKVLGPVRDASGASEAVSSGSIDVVVVDLDRVGGDGPNVVRDLARSVPVLVACDAAHPQLIDAFGVGARGVVPADRDPTMLIDAIRRAVRGELVLPEGSLGFLMRHLDRPQPSAGVLTSRERQVLCLFAKGASTTEVATDLGISSATVQSHVKSLLAKLGVHSKMEAVRVAWREGLAQVPVGA